MWAMEREREVILLNSGRCYAVPVYWTFLLLALLGDTTVSTAEPAGEGRERASFARSGGVYASGAGGGVFGELNAIRAEPDTDINDRLQAARREGLINVVQLHYKDRWSGDRKETLAKLNAWLTQTDLSLVDAVHFSEEQPYNASAWLDPLYEAVKAHDPTLPVYVWPSYPMGPLGRADGYVYDAYGEGYMGSRKKLLPFLRTGKPLILCVDASGFSDYRLAREQLMMCHEFDIPVYFFAANNGSGSYNAWYGERTAALSACRNFMFSAMEFQRRCGDPDPIAAGDFLWGEQIGLAPDAQGNVSYRWSEFGEATVYGFTRLNIADEALSVAGDAEVALDYQFWSLLPVTGARLALTVGADSAPASIRVEQSRCGRRDDWRPIAPTVLDGAPAYAVGDGGHEFRLRITLSPGAVLHGGHLSGRSEIPADRTLNLDTHFDGWRKKIRFHQKLDLGLWRGMATVDRPELLADSASLALQGKPGSGVSVAVVEKFTSEYPLQDIAVRLTGMSHSALGGAFALGVSLDGETILYHGKADRDPRSDGLFEGTHTVDLGGAPEFSGIRDFYVHMIQRNGSGLKTNTSSRLNVLEIDATPIK